MNLFINFYTDPNHERREELLTCLQNNIACEFIDKIYLIGETFFSTDSKIICIPFNSRPTYRDFFNIINQHTKPNDINIIANSDIYFKEVSYAQFTNLTPDTCYALTRWEILADGGEQFYNNSGSQDTWIFRGAIKMVEGANFTQGVAGCDNKIAYLLTQAGYKVTNPSLSIKTYHLHKSGVRYYDKKLPGQKDIFRLPKPRINVPISTL